MKDKRKAGLWDVAALEDLLLLARVCEEYGLDLEISARKMHSPELGPYLGVVVSVARTLNGEGQEVASVVGAAGFADRSALAYGLVEAFDRTRGLVERAFDVPDSSSSYFAPEAATT